MSSTFDLYRLQKIDTQLDKVQRRLDEIQQILDDNSEMKRVKAKRDAEKNAQEKAEAALRQAENAVKKQRIKIDQTEAMLYGGSVKNPKEVQDLQNKSLSLKRYLLKLEDNQLEAMLTLEEKNQKLQTAEKELEELQAALIQQNSQLAGEQSKLNQDKARLIQEKNAALPILTEKHLQLYQTLRAQKRGIAVAAVADGGCSACGATLTPSQQQKARSTNEISYCPSCRRILYGN